MLNAVNSDEEYYHIPFIGVPELETEFENLCTSGYALWTGFTLTLCCADFPVLQHCKLQVEEEWICHNIGAYGMLKKLAGKRTYTCQLVIPDEQGKSFLNFGPPKNQNFEAVSEE